MPAVGDGLMDNRDSDKDNFAGICHCPLRLVTLAGKEIETIVPISIYHHWETLEDYLVKLLARRFDLNTFGCELMLIAEDTLSPLCDPIHEELWERKRFQLIIHTSFRIAHAKEQVRRDEYDDHPKAIWVPATESGILPAKAFFALARLRHVQVEAGYHTIERQAWRYCHTPHDRQTAVLGGYNCECCFPRMLCAHHSGDARVPVPRSQALRRMLCP